MATIDKVIRLLLIARFMAKLVRLHQGKWWTRSLD
jgi:hypothetical protein